MSALLHIMHFPCFHYYIVITHYYYSYHLLHVTKLYQPGNLQMAGRAGLVFSNNE